ncbi:MAG: multiheme c-type cytochrome [Myxococcota bacterium]
MIGWGLLACAAGLDPQPVRLPMTHGPFEPSATELVGAPDPLADVQRCARCHPAAFAGWKGSAHAHASFDNPWYRASVEALREEEGRPASRHCAGCHDPVLLVTGQIEGNVDPADPLARIGVTCLVCHGTEAATPDGNGSYRVNTSEVPYPAPDGTGLAAHRARMRPAALTSGAVCGACHRGFLDERTGNASVVSGLDDLGAHAASAAAGSHARRLSPVEPHPPRGCIDCHFDGHRFAGGQTALAAQTGHLDVVLDQLQKAVQLWVVAQPQGPDLVVDVVVHNVGVGHAFPGGLGDAQDTWIALDIGPWSVNEVSDPAAHRVRTEVLDASGRPERRHHAHRIGVVAWDHRVEAGDARVFRTVVAGAAQAPEVRAELRHRPHPGALKEAACSVTTPSTLSGCGPIPEHTLAVATAAPGPPTTFDAAYAYALGLLHARSESLGEALRALAQAEPLAPNARARAAVEVLRAQLWGRQLRTESALAAAARAEAEVGPHPAITRARADALAAAWRWPEAASAFARLATEAPRDTATWRDLARARLSTGDAAGALDATAEGLARAPRDPDLLRLQASALHARNDPRAEVAKAVWMAHRRRDDASDLRLLCDREVPGCAEARLPIPVHLLRSRSENAD